MRKSSLFDLFSLACEVSKARRRESSFLRAACRQTCQYAACDLYMGLYTPDILSSEQESARPTPASWSWHSARSSLACAQCAHLLFQSLPDLVSLNPLARPERGNRTRQALSKLRVGLKVVAVMNHGGSHQGNRQLLLLVLCLLDFTQGLDIGSRALLHPVHAWVGNHCQLCYVHTCGTIAIPSCLSCISISRALNSSVCPVLTSPPIRSPAHCFIRSRRLLMFIVAVL